MKEVSDVSKICGSCQREYYTWKKKNPELENKLARMDADQDGTKDDENEVR